MTEEPKSEWKEIGTISTDTGSVIIGDPGFVLNEKDHMELYQLGEKLKWNYPIKFKDGIVESTGFGDGNYHVFSKITDFGDMGKRVTEVRIIFDVTYGFDDESKEMHDISMRELYGKVRQVQASDNTQQ